MYPYCKTILEFLYLFTDYPFRLIVVDNGSKDGSREFILKLEKEKLIWKYVFNKENLLLAMAQTEGFKVVESDLFVVCDDDMIPPMFKNLCWLTLFVTKMKKDKQIGCINFMANRQSLKSFNIKRRPLIYDKIKKEGGERLELFNKLQKIIYDK